jgi:hypothetical protein
MGKKEKATEWKERLDALDHDMTNSHLFLFHTRSHQSQFPLSLITLSVELLGQYLQQLSK